MEARVEKFIKETHPAHLRGPSPRQGETPEMKEVTRQLEQLPPEALDAALHLLEKGSDEERNWRTFVLFFIESMYRTHTVSDAKHREVAQVVFKQMLQPEQRPIDVGNVQDGLEFFYLCGLVEDVEKLIPLLSDPNPEVRRVAKLILPSITNTRGLPDSVLTESVTTPVPKTPEPPSPISTVPSPIPKQTESRTVERRPGATPVSTVPIASGGGRWAISIAALLASGILLMWIGQARLKKR
jgi:hypothetical protein